MAAEHQTTLVLPPHWKAPTKKVERVARAIVRAAGYDPDRVYSYSFDQFTSRITDYRPVWMHHVKEASAAIAALEARRG